MTPTSRKVLFADDRIRMLQQELAQLSEEAQEDVVSSAGGDSPPEDESNPKSQEAVRSAQQPEPWGRATASGHGPRILHRWDLTGRRATLELCGSV